MPQSLSNLLLHLIYSTKHREPLITTAIEAELYAYKVGILRDLGCPSLLVNGTADHVHILSALSRTKAVCEIVEAVKKGTSKWIKTKGPSFQVFTWQQGYGVFAVSESNAAEVRQCIADQKSHHQTRSFQEEYRGFLRKHRIAFDEAYVWD